MKASQVKTKTQKPGPLSGTAGKSGLQNAGEQILGGTAKTEKEQPRKESTLHKKKAIGYDKIEKGI